MLRSQENHGNQISSRFFDIAFTFACDGGQDDAVLHSVNSGRLPQTTTGESAN